MRRARIHVRVRDAKIRGDALNETGKGKACDPQMRGDTLKKTGARHFVIRPEKMELGQQLDERGGDISMIVRAESRPCTHAR